MINIFSSLKTSKLSTINKKVNYIISSKFILVIKGIENIVILTKENVFLKNI
jgi:hypothetical protein